MVPLGFLAIPNSGDKETESQKVNYLEERNLCWREAGNNEDLGVKDLSGIPVGLCSHSWEPVGEGSCE